MSNGYRSIRKEHLPYYHPLITRMYELKGLRKDRAFRLYQAWNKKPRMPHYQRIMQNCTRKWLHGMCERYNAENAATGLSWEEAWEEIYREWMDGAREE